MGLVEIFHLKTLVLPGFPGKSGFNFSPQMVDKCGLITVSWQACVKVPTSEEWYAWFDKGFWQAWLKSPTSKALWAWLTMANEKYM